MLEARKRNVGIFSKFVKNQKLFTVPDLFKFAPKSKILINSVLVKGGGAKSGSSPHLVALLPKSKETCLLKNMINKFMVPVSTQTLVIQLIAFSSCFIRIFSLKINKKKCY